MPDTEYIRKPGCCGSVDDPMAALTSTSRAAAVTAIGFWCLLFGALSASPAQAQVRDPFVQWRTLDTEHFTIHYHTPLGVVARRAALVAERAHSALAPFLGYQSPRRTQIVLTDGTDSANGSATALPLNTIRLNATAPPALSALSDYDDWLGVLVNHEHTHILHLDTWSGAATIVNLLLGKVYAPNHIEPPWILEGLATFLESERTAGGRMRSTMFEMFIRMDALEDRFLEIDQLANNVDRFPHGNARYLYGSRFIRYVVNRFGREAMARFIREYGGELLPYGVNRVMHRVTGHTWVELYSDFTRERLRHYRAVRDRVVAEGRVEGERITQHGEGANLPRFVGDGRLAYWRADNRSRTEVRLLSLDAPGEQTTAARANGHPGYAMHPSRRYLIYSRVANDRNIYFLHDLYRRDLETGEVNRLTTGLRAREPDISPDGRRVVFTTNRAGTTHLEIAETRDVEGTHRRLIESEVFEQVFNPRFSPDGRTIAFSRWERGGYRDVQLYDIASGSITHITHDRALDTGPTWSADGRTLYFSSDRTGIANIYAHDIASGQLRQITNVVAGAYQPAVSADGEHLVYVGFTSYGFDLFHLPLAGQRSRPAPAYVDRRPPSHLNPDGQPLELYNGLSRDYQPLETLWPRAYLLDLTNDGFGMAAGITIEGRDLVGLHRYTFRGTTGFEGGHVNADISYVYQGTPVGLSARVFRRVAPRSNFRVGGESVPWIEEAWGGEVAASWSLPDTFRNQTLGLTWRGTYTDNLEPLRASLDPNTEPPVLPARGFSSELRLSWSFTNIERYLYDISASNGTSLGFTTSAAHPIIGSEFSAVSITWFLRQYLTMPWLRHHVLAFAYSGGIAAGDPNRSQTFAIGGFVDSNPAEGLLNNLILGGVALRGYPAFDRGGDQFHLMQLEYRFPIWRINRGPWTLPIYLNRLHASVFIDGGDAFFGTLNFETFRIGVGAALMLDFTLGHLLPFTLRIGYARGLMDGGIDQVFGHIGVPF